MSPNGFLSFFLILRIKLDFQTAPRVPLFTIWALCDFSQRFFSVLEMGFLSALYQNQFVLETRLLAAYRAPYGFRHDAIYRRSSIFFQNFENFFSQFSNFWKSPVGRKWFSSHMRIPWGIFWHDEILTKVSFSIFKILFFESWAGRRLGPFPACFSFSCTRAHKKRSHHNEILAWGLWKLG